MGRDGREGDKPVDGAKQQAAGAPQPDGAAAAPDVAAAAPDVAAPVVGDEGLPFFEVMNLLITLTRRGLGAYREERSKKSRRELSFRDSRTLLLSDIDKILKKHEEVMRPVYITQLKSLKERYKNPDAREIVEAIFDNITSAAKGIASTVSNVGLSAAEKMTSVRKAVVGFFRDLAEKLAASRIAAAAAIANGFSKMASNIDSGRVSIANAMTRAGLRAGNAGDRVLASMRRAGVNASEGFQDKRRVLGQSIAGEQLPPRERQKEQRIGAIDAALGESTAGRALRADAAKQKRDADLREREEERKKFRRVRRVRPREFLRDLSDMQELDPKNVSASGAPLSPAPTPVVPPAGSVSGLRGGKGPAM